MRAELEGALAHPVKADWATVAEDVLEDLGRVQRLAELVDQMLVLARIDEKAPLAGECPMDLDELVLSECMCAREREGLLVDFRAVSAARVRGEPDRLRQSSATWWTMPPGTRSARQP